VKAAPELTTVGPDLAVVHQGCAVRRHQGLTPDTAYELDGFSFRTLAEPGQLLATFATVNDVHFGEDLCGVIDGSDAGPVFRSSPGEAPYPEVMNRAAVAEMAAMDPDAVVVKGDLTSNGTAEEYDAFRAVYEPAFGERLTVVRGNHESYNHATYAAEPFQEVALPGATLAVIDTSIDGEAAGSITTTQLEQIDELGARADRPVLLFGHHRQRRARRPTAPSASIAMHPRRCWRWWPVDRRSGPTSPAIPTGTACAASPPPATWPGWRWHA
jgi:predicted phosphodiesterase